MERQGYGSGPVPANIRPVFGRQVDYHSRRPSLETATFGPCCPALRDRKHFDPGVRRHSKVFPAMHFSSIRSDTLGFTSCRCQEKVSPSCPTAQLSTNSAGPLLIQSFTSPSQAMWYTRTSHRLLIRSSLLLCKLLTHLSTFGGRL